MGTAISRRLAHASLLLALCAAGCGSSSGSASQSSTTASSSSAPSTSATASSGSLTAQALSELKPAQVPSGWQVARIPDGAVMPYPPGWSLIHGDRGTATAALLDAGQRYLGYLNVTPRQANENLAGWAAFRVHHNAEEGERDLQTLAARNAVRVRGGRGNCVEDSYKTTAGTRYIEIACLIAGPRTTAVVVGAAAPGSWARVAPMLEQAISAASA
jgi:hypothetical protein